MRNRLIINIIVLVLFVSIVVTGCSSAASMESPSDFYKGKTVTMVLDSEPGAFIDLISRVIAKHLSDDVKATVVVENRREAGGLEGTNYLYKAAPDGLTIGSVNPIKFISNKVLNDPAAVYEIEKFSYLLKIDNQQTYFFVSSTGPYQSINDLKAGKSLKLAGGTAAGQVTLAGLTIIDTLNLDARVITGFASHTERALATVRGEVTGFAINYSAVRSEVESGRLKPLFILASRRDPVKPDIPAISELVNLTDEQLALMKLWENSLSGGTLFTAPPGLPADRLSFLRGLADEWSKNKTCRQEIDSLSGYGVQEYFGGEQLNQTLRGMAGDLNKYQSVFTRMINKYRS